HPREVGRVPVLLPPPIAAAASPVHHPRRPRLVDFPLGGILVAGALVGAVIGTLFTLVVLDERTFKGFFAGVLLLFGAYMVLDWVRNKRSVDEDNDALRTRPRVMGTAVATAGSGFLSGSMGIGGGLR